MSTEREHKKYSPSRSEQFFLCPGAPNLLARTPARATSVYAEEGTLAHYILEAGLRNRSYNATHAINQTEYAWGILEALHEGTLIKNIIEFKSSINDALDYVWGLMDMLEAVHGDPQLFIETRVNPPILSMPGEAAGYCDIAIYSASARHLWVIDYKHGAGVAKAAKGNTQVKQYAAGFLYDTTTPVDPEAVDHVTLVIIQPRAFHPDGDIREYTTTPLELADYLIELDLQIAKCEDPDAPLVPGVEQCRFCDARPTCPAAEQAALAVANNHFASVRDVREPSLPVVETLDPGRVGYIIQVAPMLESWLNDVRKYAYDLQMNGVHVPGTKLVETQARREWYGEEEDRAKKLAALIGCKPDKLYRTSFRTLTDIERDVVDAFKARAKKGKKKQAAEEAKQMFAYFTIKQSSGNLTLVTDDDPRPPANRALRSFTGVAGLLPPPSTVK